MFWYFYNTSVTFHAISSLTPPELQISQFIGQTQHRVAMKSTAPLKCLRVRIFYCFAVLIPHAVSTSSAQNQHDAASGVSHFTLLVKEVEHDAWHFSVPLDRPRLKRSWSRYRLNYCSGLGVRTCWKGIHFHPETSRTCSLAPASINRQRVHATGIPVRLNVLLTNAVYQAQVK